MKIIFILPAIGKKPGKKYIETWKMEPLTIATLKALLPENIQAVFYDDRTELINYDDDEIVFITSETYNAMRSYEIAQKFRDNGKKIIFGGYHATLFPKEVKEFGDSVVMLLTDIEKKAVVGMGACVIRKEFISG